MVGIGLMTAVLRMRMTLPEATLITAATHVVEQAAAEMHHLLIGPQRSIAKEERDQDERVISFCKVGPYYCWYSASFSWVGLFESFTESKRKCAQIFIQTS